MDTLSIWIHCWFSKTNGVSLLHILKSARRSSGSIEEDGMVWCPEAAASISSIVSVSGTFVKWLVTSSNTRKMIIGCYEIFDMNEEFLAWTFNKCLLKYCWIITFMCCANSRETVPDILIIGRRGGLLSFLRILGNPWRWQLENSFTRFRVLCMDGSKILYFSTIFLILDFMVSVCLISVTTSLGQKLGCLAYYYIYYRRFYPSPLHLLLYLVAG